MGAQDEIAMRLEKISEKIQEGRSWAERGDGHHANSEFWQAELLLRSLQRFILREGRILPREKTTKGDY
jgi:hypothetical protein